MPLAPLQQGSLDCLCGVYAIANAVRWFAEGRRPLRRAQQTALFSHLLAAAGRHVGLHEALTIGLDIKPMLKLCRAASRFAEAELRLSFTVNRPFAATASLSDVAAGMRASFDAAPTALIVGLWGAHDHWSVCTAVTDHSLILFDSSGLRRVALKHCAVIARHDARATARHRLPARAIISLRVRS